MKQKLLMTTLVALLPWMATARTVWTGTQVLDWNGSGQYATVGAATLGTVNTGDYVVLRFDAEASAQIHLNSMASGWPTMAGRSVSTSETVWWIKATGEMDFTSGIAVTGVNATLTQVDVEEGTDYANSVWVGETVIAKDWSTWQTVDASAFSSAVENYCIRFKFKDVLSGAQFGLQYNNGSDWLTMPGVSNVSISSLYQQYTISAEMLTALQTYGCIVRGAGYTLTAIDIIDPSTLKTLTLSVASDETNSGWVYTTTAPTIKISIQNDNDEAVTANAVVRLYTDAYASYKTANVSQSVAAGTTETLEVSFSDVAPGFYRVYATVNDEMAHSAFIIGVNPTSIVSAADKQNDFDSFWQTAKSQLATIEAADTPVLIEITSKSTDARKVYLVEFKSVPDGLTGDGVTVRGYYCEPTDDSKTYPVIMHYLGYDSGYRPGGESSTPYCPSGDANPGYAEFYLSTRGQSVNNRTSAERDDGIASDFINTYGDWFAFNFGDKDSYYYRGAYMDCVRAIDFMASRSTSDMTNLFAEGQSQGGAFTYAAAALSGRTFKAIAPAIPFMGDFPDYFQVGNWPASVATTNQGEMSDNEMYAFLSYFDTKNLATMVNCPIITSIGLQDNVCPPHTNIAPYNNVKTAAVDKQIVYNPELAHQVNGSWYTTYNTFFKGYEGLSTEESLLWYGESDLTASSWSQYCTIDNARALTLEAGDQIAVTVSAASKATASWPSVRPYSGSTSLTPSFGFWNEVDNSATFPITKSDYLCQADIDLIQSNGLKMSGAGCTLTKVVRIPFNPVLWEGTSETVSWNAAYTVPETLVKDLAVGDILRVTIASADFVSGSKWPAIWFRTKVTNADDNTKTDTEEVQKTNLYANSAAVVCPYVVDYVVTESDLTKLTDKNSLYITGSNYTFSKVELVKYEEPTKTLNVETVLYEGTTALTNWSQNYNQPTSVINSLQAGDVLTVTIDNKTDGSTNSQIRIAWGGTDGTYVSETGIQNKEFPYEFSLTLTAAQVTAIQTAKKLYLNGCNIVVSKWTLTQQKTVSRERGGASTTVWTGSEVVSWNAGAGNNSPQIAASAFANAATDMKVRVNFSSMKLGAQGRIIKSGYETFDGVSTKKLPTECGDYFEYTISEDMLTELQANGMRINGVGYTATSVELIDPMKEYIINATFDTDDIKAWEPTDGTPNLTVTLTNYEEQEVTTTVSASLMTDMFADYKNYSVNVTLDAGETRTIDLPITGLEPGFYRMAAKANGNQLCTYYIGYNPTAIVSPDDSQADFAEFWGTWKARLAAIPVDAELTLLNGDDSDAKRNIYEVAYQSVPETVGGDPVTIYGYYAEPKDEGTYPCIIHFHGTSKTAELTMPSGTTEGWCEFRFSARGQTLDKAKHADDTHDGSEKYRTDPDDASSVDFYAYELGDNDKHYYRYVYLDTRRAVDFVYSQAKVNKDQVFAAGGSQGGCLTYVCAALSDGKIRAIAPSITGHADFVHTMEIVGWPTNVFNNWINAKVADNTYADYATAKAALLAHQSYFDTKNFAKWIYCPVITNFSLQDQTDGPHLNISPYNLLVNVAAADKQYSINQFKGHAAADNWTSTYMAFFQNYIEAGEPLTIDNPVTISAATYGTYYNSTATQLPAGVKAATIDGADETTNTVTINWRYDGDDTDNNVIPGGTAVMLKSEAGSHTLTLLPSNTDAAPSGNLLHGSDVKTTTTGDGKHYKLSYGPSSDPVLKDQLGWYYGAADGAAFPIGAHKAWLVLPASLAREATFFTLDGGETTGVKSIDNLTIYDLRFDADAWYTLNGRRLQGKPTTKGLYIHNGRTVVIH